MTNIQELFKEEIWQPDDLTNAVWFTDCGEVSYNKDKNTNDLFEGDGETYSGGYTDYTEKGGYVIMTIDSYCGYSYQAIFSLSLKQESE
jgi:hypothetical protein